MFALMTDFGWGGPYIGQMKAVLVHGAPQVPVVDLMHDLPAFDARRAAYLVAAYSAGLPVGSVVVAVVDPGVGSARAGLALQADGRWYLGPDNGLLSIVVQRAKEARVWQLPQADGAAPTFHGRDIFAPWALRVIKEGVATGLPVAPGMVGGDWPADLDDVCYLDGYGNAVTGRRGAGLAEQAQVVLGERRLRWARTFSEVAGGEGFWYSNSSGLVEIAVNGGSAARQFGLEVGTRVRIDRMAQHGSEGS